MTAIAADIEQFLHENALAFGTSLREVEREKDERCTNHARLGASLLRLEEDGFAALTDGAFLV